MRWIEIQLFIEKIRPKESLETDFNVRNHFWLLDRNLGKILSLDHQIANGITFKCRIICQIKFGPLDHPYDHCIIFKNVGVVWVIGLM